MDRNQDRDDKENAFYAGEVFTFQWWFSAAIAFLCPAA